MSTPEDIVNQCLLSLQYRLTDNLNNMHPSNYKYIMEYDRTIRYETQGITAGGYLLMNWTQFDVYLKNMYIKTRNLAINQKLHS